MLDFEYYRNLRNYMSALIFDIETVGEDFDSMDETTQSVLTRWVNRSTENDEERAARLTDIKESLGFSPLTGKIVAIGVLDSDKDTGAVYFEDPDGKISESEQDGIKYKPMDEAEMLEQFWKLCEKYDNFVSFNGRAFDVPFMAIRSAIHGIRPCKDLLSNRYLSLQKRSCAHIDLADQLSFYGAVRKNSPLHLYARAFGIESPKSQGVSGDDVAELFRTGQYETIAKYNARDIRATRLLYEKWRDYIAF